MDEIQPYLETDIPEGVMLASMAIFCVAVVVILVLSKSFATAKKGVMWAMLLEYVAMVLASTVLFRETCEEYRYQLTPFYSYDMPEGSEPMMWQVLMNVVLFVPIGLLLGGLTDKWWKTLAGGCLLSMSIELLQLVFRKGLCETDDVIHNTLGALVGMVVYYAISKGLKVLNGSEKF